MQTTQAISKISPAEPKTFIELFKFYNKANTNPEVCLKLEKDGLSFSELSMDNTLLTSIEILSNSFMEFGIKPSKKCLNSAELLKFLKRANKEDILIVEFEENDYRVILKNGVLRQFNSKLIDYEERSGKMPNLDHKAHIKVDSKSLFDAFKNYKKNDMDKAVIEVLNGKAILSLIDGNNEIRDSIELNGEVKSEANLKSMFSFELLKNSITKNLSGEITMFLSQDYPLLIRYLEVDKFKAEVVIAPRVEEKPKPVKVKFGDKNIEKKISDAVDKIVEKAEDKSHYEEPKKEDVAGDDVGIDPRPVTAKSKRTSKPKGKIDLNDIGYSDSMKCPECRGLIDIQHFSDKFTTPIGLLRDIVEEDYNGNIKFLEFALDKEICEDINEGFEKLIREKLKEHEKKFRGS